MIVTRRDAEYFLRNKAVYDQKKVASCTYVKDGAPECIVGQVLHDLGVTIESLDIYGGTGFQGIWEDETATGKNFQVDYPDLQFTPGAVVVLNDVQMVQDGNIRHAQASAGLLALERAVGYGNMGGFRPWQYAVGILDSPVYKAANGHLV